MKKALLAAMGLGGAFLGVGNFFMNRAIVRYPDKKSEKVKKKERKKGGYFGTYQPYVDESVTWLHKNVSQVWQIESEDKLQLRAYLLENKEAKGVFLAAHGYRCQKHADIACQARYFYNLGYHVLAIDQRCHGNSQGLYIGMGVLERKDCLLWIEKLDRYFKGKMPIYLFGVSMGASTVLMTGALDMPASVRGIIADCGYTSPWNIFSYIARTSYKFFAFPILYGAELWSRWRAHYSYKEVNLLKELEKNKLPVLFIHGGEDDFVPTYMGIENYKACKSRKHILIVDGAAHAMSYLVGRKAYEKAIADFLEETK